MSRCPRALAPWACLGPPGELAHPAHQLQPVLPLHHPDLPRLRLVEPGVEGALGRGGGGGRPPRRREEPHLRWASSSAASSGAACTQIGVASTTSSTWPEPVTASNGATPASERGEPSPSHSAPPRPAARPGPRWWERVRPRAERARVRRARPSRRLPRWPGAAPAAQGERGEAVAPSAARSRGRRVEKTRSGSAGQWVAIHGKVPARSMPQAAASRDASVLSGRACRPPLPSISEKYGAARTTRGRRDGRALPRPASTLWLASPSRW